MHYRNLVSLALGISILQLTPMASAASQNEVMLAAMSNLQSGGVGADTTLYKARWSLPANGALKGPEAPKAAVDEEDFPTPASVEAEAKRKASSKKAKKDAAAASGASAPQPGSPSSAAATATTSNTAAGNAQAPQAVAVPARSNKSQEGPMVRLTISPAIPAQDSAPKKAVTVPALRTIAPAPPVQTIQATQRIQPTPTGATNAPSRNPAALRTLTDSSTDTNNQSAAGEPLPALLGAPLPGDQDQGTPPAKTSDKPTTKASANTGTVNSDGQVIQLGVSVWDTANVSKIVEHLVDMHVSRSKEALALDKKVDHFRSTTSRTFAGAKDVLNQNLQFEGTDPSQRMGRLVLDDKAKIRDHTTAEFERQKYVDKIHSQVVSSLAQIATGLGTADSVRGRSIVNAGAKSLSDLVGDEQAGQAVKNLTTWLGNMKVPDSVFQQPAWDTMERDSKLEKVIRAALEKDPVVAEIKQRVNRYANPGKVKANTSKVVDITLNTAALLSPGFAIPIAAEAALDSYVMMTGGTEESKLEKELVYDKRIQSRLRVLNTEASLALDNYRFALVTKNAPLLSFSQAVISDMSSEPVAKQVLVSQSVSEGQKSPQVIPELTESRDSRHPANSADGNLVKSTIKQITGL